MAFFTRQTRVFIAGALSGTCVGSLLTLSIYEQYAILHESREKAPEAQKQQSVLEKKCVEVGYPSQENIRVTSAYACSFSPLYRTPLWVMEYFSNETLDTLGKNSTVSRDKSTFSSDRQVDSKFRSTNSEYHAGQDLGLSRGHLAPAQMHKGSQEEMNDTFNLSLNIVPQLMSTNGCDWFRLEQMAKKLVKLYDESWVITGPAFIPTDYVIGNESEQRRRVWTTEYSLIGENRIAVPTHIFKVILSKDTTLHSKYQCAAFILPNKPIAKELPMTDYQVDIEELESLTGLHFFPKLTGKRLFTEKRPKTPLLTASRSTGFADICQSNVCEGSYGSFGKMFRHLSKMQSAASVDELDALWNDAKAMGFTRRLEKDYKALRKKFAY